MKTDLDVLAQCPLFRGIAPEEISAMLDCLEGKQVEVQKGSPVFLEGDPATYVGVVLSGRVNVVRDDFYGSRSVLTAVTPGGLFGEAFACAGLETLPVSVIALQNSTVLLLNCRQLLTGCTGGCSFHSRLIQNLLQVIAAKNLTLTQKIRCMSRKTTREKLLEYLLDQAKKQGSPEFTIPFNRQSLADFLGVERSAMSAELGKLQKDGILKTTGSHFRILSAHTAEEDQG